VLLLTSAATKAVAAKTTPLLIISVKQLLLEVGVVQVSGTLEKLGQAAAAGRVA